MLGLRLRNALSRTPPTSSELMTFLNPNLSNSLHNKILTCTVKVILRKSFFLSHVLSFTFVGYYKAHIFFQLSQPSVNGSFLSSQKIAAMLLVQESKIKTTTTTHRIPVIRNLSSTFSTLPGDIFTGKN